MSWMLWSGSTGNPPASFPATEFTSKAILKCYIESFNGSLRDKCLNEEIFDTLADARRTLALWRYDYNNVRPHSSLGNKTPAETRRALELLDGTAVGAHLIRETDTDTPNCVITGVSL